MDWILRLGKWSKVVLIASFAALFLGLAVAEAYKKGDWSDVFVFGALILSLVCLYVVARLVLPLWESFISPIAKKIINPFDRFLERWLLHPLIRRFEESEGIRIQDFERVLMDDSLGEAEIQRLYQAAEQYRDFLNALHYVLLLVGIATLVAVLGASYALRLMWWAEDLICLFVPVMFLVGWRLFNIILEDLGDLVDVAIALEIPDSIRKELVATESKLEELRRLIDEHEVELCTLESDRASFLSIDEATQQSTINLFKAFLEKRDRDRLLIEETQVRASRRWDLAKDVILGVIFLLIGLVLAQIPSINDFIEQFIQAVSLG